MCALSTNHKHRDFLTDATRPRRYSIDPAKRQWYAKHRTERQAHRLLGR